MSDVGLAEVLEQIKKKFSFCERFMKDAEKKIKDKTVNVNLREFMDYQYFKGARDGIKEVLAVLEPLVARHTKQLQDLKEKIKDKHHFESEHTRLDRESGYVISKPQQELVNFLAWLDEEFERVLEGNKK